MVKNAKPRAVRIFHIKGHPRVKTDIPVLFYIFPNFFNDPGRIPPCFHAKGKSGADGAIYGKLARNGLAADAASLVAYGDNFDVFDKIILSQGTHRSKGLFI